MSSSRMRLRKPQPIANRYNHHGKGEALKTELIPGMIVNKEVREAEIAQAKCIQGFRLNAVKNHSHVRTCMHAQNTVESCAHLIYRVQK